MGRNEQRQENTKSITSDVDGGGYIYIYIYIALGVRLFSQNHTVYLLIPCSSATLCFVDFNAVEGASLLDTNIDRVKTVIVEGVRM